MNYEFYFTDNSIVLLANDQEIETIPSNTTKLNSLIDEWVGNEWHYIGLGPQKFRIIV